MASTDTVAPAAGDASAGTAVTTPAPAPAAPAGLREDQIQNAVAFLTHPKVQGSPTATKRSFLERKGLTAAEIDEAFKRAPEAPSSTPSTLSQPVTGPSTGLITYQQQPTQQQGALVPVSQPQQFQVQPVQPVQQAPEPLRWSQVLLGVGVVAAGVYAVKALVFPYAHDWYKSWAEKARAQREAQERQAAALEEAAAALKACQAQLQASNQAMSSLVASLKEQPWQQGAVQQASEHRDLLLQELSDIRRQLTMLGTSSQRPQGTSGSSVMGSLYGDERAYRPDGSRGAYANGTAPWQSPSSAMPPPYPGGSNSIAPPPKGYLGGYSGNLGSSSASSQAGRSEMPPVEGRHSPPPAPPSGGEPYPTSFHEVMEMVKKGITPPNVRKDIKDTPPDPSRPLPDATAKPSAKPWEYRGAAGNGSSASTTAPYPAATQPEFAITPSFDPMGGFSSGWGMPAQTAAGPGSSSSATDAHAGAGSSVPAVEGYGLPGGSSSGSMFTSIFRDVRSGPSTPQSPAMPSAHPPATHPPVSVLGEPNLAWKPPAAPMPTVKSYTYRPDTGLVGAGAGASMANAASAPPVGSSGSVVAPDAQLVEPVAASVGSAEDTPASAASASAPLEAGVVDAGLAGHVADADLQA